MPNDDQYCALPADLRVAEPHEFGRLVITFEDAYGYGWERRGDGRLEIRPTAEERAGVPNLIPPPDGVPW